MLSCGGSSSSGPAATPGPGYSLEAITISNGPPPTPSFTATATATATSTSSATKTHTPKPTTTKTPKMTPTLTPRPAAISTNVPSSVPTGGMIAFDAIGTFTKKSKIQYQDITTGTQTLWTSSDPTKLLAPASGSQGGIYTTGFAGCVCILASSSGVSSQSVGVGVYVDVDTCPLCGPTPTPTATSTPPVVRVPGASSTPAASTHSAGVLMWVFDPGAELRGRIAVGGDGSIFFITRDGVLHGVNSSGKEIMRRDVDGSSPAVLPDGTVVAMLSRTELGAVAPDGTTLWHVEIGESAGPLVATDRAIYASAGSDLVSLSTSGTLNWRVNVGPVTTAATTPDGVVAGTSRGVLTAIASDGAVVWTFQPDGGFSGSVAYADDVVYAGSAGGGVYAIDSRSGNPLWRVNSAHPVTAGPAVAPSGTIFAGADTLYGVSADGHLRWKDPTLKPGDAGLLALGYDAVFDAATGDVGAVLMGDGSYVWTSRSFGKITTVATSASGMLYVGTSTGRIFAVR
jgi:outer membrane protein assembly factor BamB